MTTYFERESRLMPGFIFVPEPSTRMPDAYCAKWHDHCGYFAQLTPTHISGHFPVTVETYVRAAEIHSCLMERTSKLNELSDKSQAATQVFVTEIEANPRSTEAPSLIEAACQARSDQMAAHILYLEAKNAWEAATADVSTEEEMEARRLAFVHALEVSEDEPQVHNNMNNLMVH
jgi:hypothetical protein